MSSSKNQTFPEYSNESSRASTPTINTFTISELIRLLQQKKKELGDVPVYTVEFGAIKPIQSLEVQNGQLFLE